MWVPSAKGVWGKKNFLCLLFFNSGCTGKFYQDRYTMSWVFKVGCHLDVISIFPHEVRPRDPAWIHVAEHKCHRLNMCVCVCSRQLWWWWSLVPRVLVQEVGPWGGDGPMRGSSPEWEQCPYERTPRACAPLPPCEDTAREVSYDPGAAPPQTLLLPAPGCGPLGLQAGHGQVCHFPGPV